jgi:hypothetical protein
MPCLLAVLLTGGAIGCTFKGVAPEILKAPSQKYQIVVIGDITVEDKLWDSLVPHFRTGLAKELARQKAFDAVLETPPVPMPDSAVVFSGKITEVHKGSQALRFFVGYGAGQARVSGVFEISETGGEPLAKLTATESYLGGAGFGGADLLLPEDLMRRFGESMADKIVKWSRGEKIE